MLADIMKLKRPGSGEARSNEPEAALMRATYVPCFACCRDGSGWEERSSSSRLCLLQLLPLATRPHVCNDAFAKFGAGILMGGAEILTGGAEIRMGGRRAHTRVSCLLVQLRQNARDRQQGLPGSVVRVHDVSRCRARPYRCGHYCCVIIVLSLRPLSVPPRRAYHYRYYSITIAQ